MPSRPSILFVHGAHCDARVWHRGFLQSFEQRGWSCRAIDLPGHGSQRLAAVEREQLGLQDYVRALAGAVRDLGGTPVLVGHSMGGYVVQRFVLEGGQASAVVLLASAPPQGMGRDALLFALRHPLLAVGTTLAAREGPTRRLQRVRDMLMTARTPHDTVQWVLGQLQRESALAMRELAQGALPAHPLGRPLLALAGAHDKLVSLASQRALAKAYQVPLHVQQDMAHMVMLEPGWQQVADLVAGFLVSAIPPAPR